MKSLGLSTLSKYLFSTVSWKIVAPWGVVEVLWLNSWSSYFKGRNFRVFRVFVTFSRKFMPLEISKQQNAKVFSREITDNFKNAKVFSREKKLFFQANLRPLPEIRCYRKNQRHMDGYY